MTIGINFQFRNAKSIFKFKKSVITQKLENSSYNVHDTIGLKLLSRLKLRFTHLDGRKLRLGFNDTVNPMCPCRADKRPLNIFFCVAIAFLPRDLNFSIIFTVFY